MAVGSERSVFYLGLPYASRVTMDGPSALSVPSTAELGSDHPGMGSQGSLGEDVGSHSPWGLL